MRAAQQRRVRGVADIEHRDDGVLGGGVTLGGDEQAAAVEDHLVRAAGELGRGDDVGVGDRDDAQPVLTSHVDVAAIGLDDVTLVDTDLLGVGAGVPDVLGGGSRRGRRLDARSRTPGRVLGHRHVDGHAGRVVAAALETPGRDPLAGFDLHVGEQLGAVTEERQPGEPEPAIPAGGRDDRIGRFSGVRGIGGIRGIGRIGRGRERRRCRPRIAGPGRLFRTVGAAAGRDQHGEGGGHDQRSLHGCSTPATASRFPR